MKLKRIGSLLLSMAICLTSVSAAVPQRAVAASVREPITGIFITRKNIAVQVGSTYSLKLRILANKANIEWSSDQPAVASVDQSGIVTAKGIGEANITVKMGPYSDSCKIRVVKQNPTAAEYDHQLELKRDFNDQRFGMFFHFNSSTVEFKDRGGDWDGATRKSTFDPANWDPSELDCDQWAAAAKSAGMKFGVLTTKHHDGFCLWDSAYTTYDVGSGTTKTDVVKAYVEAFRKQGLKPGLYYSMLDLKHEIDADQYAGCTEEKVEFLKGQIRELLTHYGEIPYLIIDGWNADWGGPSYEKVPYEEIQDLVHSIQPDCLLINISCEANETHSEMTIFENGAGQEVPEWYQDPSIACNTLTPCWFWMSSYPEMALKSVDYALNQKLIPMMGQNTTFILNASPNPQGKLDQNFIDRFAEIGQRYQKPADVAEIPNAWLPDYEHHESLTFRRPTSQSGTEGKAFAARAVDGRIDPDVSHDSVSSTGQQGSPWWQVDFGHVESLGQASIVGCSGSDELKDATLFISEKEFASNATFASLTADTSVKKIPLKEQNKGDYSNNFVVNLTGIQGRYLRIAYNKSANLQLAEVNVTRADAAKTAVPKKIKDQITDRYALLNKPKADIHFPAAAMVAMSDGTLQKLSLVWDSADYNGSQAGTYTFIGTLKDAKDLSVPAKVHVLAEPAVQNKEVTVSSIRASSHWGDTEVGDARPINVINKSGLTINKNNLFASTHDNPGNASSMWHTADGQTTGWLVFDFGSERQIDNMWIWNHNQSENTNRGVKNCTVYYTLDADPNTTSWSKVDDYVLTEASGKNGILPTDLLYLGGIKARQIKLDIQSNYGGGSNTGMSEVMFSAVDTPVARESIPVEDVTSSSSWPTLTPRSTCDMSGLTFNGTDLTAATHDNHGSSVTMWHSASGASQATLTYDFGSKVSVDEMWIWNHNQSNNNWTRGLKDVEISYSDDGQNWQKLGDYVFAMANGSENCPATNLEGTGKPVDFGGKSMRYVKLHATSTWRGQVSEYGLAEVMFMKTDKAASVQNEPSITPVTTVAEDGQEIALTAQGIEASSYWGDTPVGNARPINLINQSGFTRNAADIASSTHDNPNDALSMWHTADGQTLGSVTVDLGEAWPIHKLYVWNHNQEGSTNRGMKSVTITYTTDADAATAAWKKLGDYTFTEASGENNMTANNVIEFGDQKARLIKLDCTENYGGDHTGLSELVFSTKQSQSKPVGSRGSLMTQISRFELYSRLSFTSDSYAAAANIYKEAKAIFQNPASTPEQMGAAEEALRTAMENLVEADAPKAIDDLTNIGWKAAAGVSGLPATLEVTYTDGTTGIEPVEWIETLSAEQLSTIGSYTVQGQIEGTPHAFHAVIGITGVTNAALAAAVKEYRALRTDHYTNETVHALDEALISAETLLKNNDVTQDAIDAEKEALRRTKYALQEKPVVVQRIVLSPESIQVTVGGTAQASAVPFPAYAAADINWSVEDESIAQVDANGLITGVKAGTTKLIATLKGNETIKASAGITVTRTTETDKTALHALIAECESLKADDYTADSWQAFQNTFSAAKTIAVDNSATQTAIDQVIAELKTARKALVQKPPVFEKDGWEKDGSVWYLYKDGKIQKNWQNVDGKWYYLGNDGKMRTGWFQVGSKWYFSESSGKMVTGWKKLGKWYYFGSNGAMKTGWYQVGKSWYFSESSGKMVTGWKKLGKWYYFGSNGAMKTGWIQLATKWYYLHTNGQMITGRKQIDGVWYRFHPSGMML